MYKTLIVDDSKVLRIMLKNHLLEADEGFEEDSIFEAVNGLEALELIEKEKFDVVLTDINMPEMDGVEFSKKIKKNEKLKDLKIVIMSSRVTETQKEELEKLGVDLFLNKPIQKDTVEKLILTLIRQESAKHIIEEKFENKHPKDLITCLVDDFFYKNLDFREFTNSNYEANATAIFTESFAIALEENLKNHNEAKVLAEYLANKYTKYILENLSDIFLFELGGGNSNVKKFLSYYTGGIKVIEGERYKIPSILDKEGGVINSSTITIISQQYFKQKKTTKTLAESLEKAIEEKDEAKQNLEDEKEKSDIQDEAGEEIIPANAKEIKAFTVILEEKEQKLSQIKKRLLKHQQLAAQYKPRYQMLMTAFKEALMKKKEKADF